MAELQITSAPESELEQLTAPSSSFEGSERMAEQEVGAVSERKPSEVLDLSLAGYSPTLAAIALGYKASRQYFSSASQGAAQESDTTPESAHQGDSWYSALLGSAETAWNWLSGSLSLDEASVEQQQQIADARGSAERILGKERTDRFISDVQEALESKAAWQESADHCSLQIEEHFDELLERVESTLLSTLEEMKRTDLTPERKEDLEKLLGLGSLMREKLSSELFVLQTEAQKRLEEFPTSDPAATEALRSQCANTGSFVAGQLEKLKKLEEAQKKVLKDPKASMDAVVGAAEACANGMCAIHEENLARLKADREQADTVRKKSKLSEKEKEEVRETWNRVERLTDVRFADFEKTHVEYQRAHAELLVGIAHDRGVDLRGIGQLLLEAGERWSTAVASRWTVGLSDGNVEERFRKQFIFFAETDALIQLQKEQLRAAFGPRESSLSIYARKGSSFFDAEEEKETEDSWKVLDTAPIAESVVLSTKELSERANLLAKLQKRGIEVRGRDTTKAEKLQASVAQDLVDTLS